MKSKLMIKYGKEQHLQQIINGELRFTPSQTYIKIEETQHNKGQGDLLEGKMKIRFESAKMYDPETNKLLGVLPKSIVTIKIQDVNNMGIFCLSTYNIDCINVDNGKEIIVLPQQKLECIKNDFPEATHALIILESEKFINDVMNINDHQIACGEIHYYDYDINSLQMYMFLTTGSTEVETNKELSMTYDNRYRHLLCKDIDFAQQQEYRFIVLDELIIEPKFYQFNFTSKYMMVPIEQLKVPLTIKRI